MNLNYGNCISFFFENQFSCFIDSYFSGLLAFLITEYDDDDDELLPNRRIRQLCVQYALIMLIFATACELFRISECIRGRTLFTLCIW